MYNIMYAHTHIYIIFSHIGTVDVRIMYMIVYRICI